MIIFNTKIEIQNFIAEAKAKKQVIGFVPTMGALHEGHLSIVKRAIEETELCVVSIFVNPRQFNDKNDYNKYPRNIEKDIDILKNAGTHVLFLPKYDEVFYNESNVKINFDGLDNKLEGAFRPGHFQGVVDVVESLFSIVKPDKVFFGLKDFQQLLIIKKLVEQLFSNIKVVDCEIVRESDGLAMSSRNQRLDAQSRKISTNIYRILLSAKNMAKKGCCVGEINDYLKHEFNLIDAFKLEYVGVFNEKNLDEININAKAINHILLVAVWCGGIRLIDNIYLN